MQPWASCSHTHTRATVTKQYNLVLAQAEVVTAGLVSHWPCVADNSGITTYRLMALGREMSSLHASAGVGSLSLPYIPYQVAVV